MARQHRGPRSAQPFSGRLTVPYLPGNPRGQGQSSGHDPTATPFDCARAVCAGLGILGRGNIPFTTSGRRAQGEALPCLYGFPWQARGFLARVYRIL
jgi:hypothetical protein